jgi:hypothetical protein
MKLLTRGQSRTPLPGTRSASSSGGKSPEALRPGPGHGHGQLGQNGAFSSKKTRTGITAQPTMS